jgi:glycosyltransferase involved in cell wall biosynthesis
MRTSASDVTIVVPTRDRKDPLRRALESVRRQTHPATRTIVVDDGSRDDPESWLRADFPEVELIRQEHRGVSAARNRGIGLATTQWIAFLDSDDEWVPEKLERQMSALARETDYSICHTDEIWIRDGRRVNPGKRHAKRGGFIFQYCLPLCVISPSSVVIERSLLEEVGGFDETLPACEDYDLWLRVCARHPVLFVDESLVIKHGGHEDQLSRRYWGMDRWRIRALEKIIGSGTLGAHDRRAAVRVLLQKIDVYTQGARKRGKSDEIDRYEALREKMREEL